MSTAIIIALMLFCIVFLSYQLSRSLKVERDACEMAKQWRKNYERLAENHKVLRELYDAERQSSWPWNQRVAKVPGVAAVSEEVREEVAGDGQTRDAGGEKDLHKPEVETEGLHAGGKAEGDGTVIVDVGDALLGVYGIPASLTRKVKND